MVERQNFLQRVLRIEPGIALSQWVWDRVANNWAILVAAFGGGGGMSILASISDFLVPYGPVGVGAIGVVFALLIWLMLSWARLISAKANLRRVEASAVTEWKESIDGINPLDREFHKKRIRLLDLAHPINKKISGKRIIDCENMGPANIYVTSGG